MIFPTVSIVTPSYNQASFLRASISSVVSQGYPSLEYIVIDGGSGDDSLNIIKEFDPLISFWCSEPDSGHSHALQKGFQRSTGEIMGWINSDDMMTPWSLFAIADIFSTFPHVNWIQGFTSTWNVHGYMTSASRNPINIYDYLFGNYRWIQQESTFWRRTLWLSLIHI